MLGNMDAYAAQFVCAGKHGASNMQSAISEIVSAGERKHVQSDLLNREEAAAYLGVSPRSLAVWKSVGRYGLPVVKVGRLCKYRKADLDAWLASRTFFGQEG